MRASRSALSDTKAMTPFQASGSLERDELEPLVRRRLQEHGQDHVLRFFSELDEGAKQTLLEQIAAIDFDLLERLRAAMDDAPEAESLAECRPAEVLPIPRTDEERRDEARAREKGEELLRAGRVAVLTVAGGQGTRLGFDDPKGMFPIGPVTERTLFQLFAEKVRATGDRYGEPIPWMILTSDATHDATVRFFEDQDRFDLPRDLVRFLRQGSMPAVDPEGKLLLAEKGRLVTSPNGHGGSLLALRDEGGLDVMREAGADLLFYFQVDNPLVVAPDPVLLGHHESRGAEMSTKVVSKRNPREKVGLLCEIDGRTRVIEYSDLDEDRMHAREPDGSLRYRAGNIAIHVFDRSFLERLTTGEFRLPYHFARKAIPHVGPDGRRIEPEEPNGIKFETFVFDAMPLASPTFAQEVRREEEFSPVKNRTGDSSPKTARRALVDLYGSWLESAGIRVPRDPEGHVRGRIEISPRFARNAEELRRRVASAGGIEFRDGLVLSGPQ